MRDTSRAFPIDIEGSVGLSSLEQFKAHLSVLKPKDGNRQIFFKFGHDKFVVGEFDKTGLFPIYETIGAGEFRKRGKLLGPAFTVLDRLSQQNDGGVFIIPTQPIGQPLVKCVDSTDVIVAEIDSLDEQGQDQRHQEFSADTGLLFTVKLTSGGKSRHVWIKLDKHYPAAQAQYLRFLVCLLLRSDPVTTRLHQPVRVAGFYRKEKNAFQQLLELNPVDYSYEQVVEGCRKGFAALGWQFPEQITQEWFSKRFFPILKGCAKNSEEYKVEAIRAELELGLDGWLAELEAKKVEQAERARQRQLKAAQLELEGKLDLVEMVRAVGVRLGADGFDDPAHNWKFSSDDHARGGCLWHDSKSGTSAWLSRKNGNYTFHCTHCNNDAPIGHFVYWLYRRRGWGAAYPTGKDYVETATAYLREYGVEVPEFKPQPKSEISRDEWLKKREESGRGFGEPDPAKEREQQIKKRDFVFRTKFADALKRDFLLGKCDIEYEGFCPTFKLGLSRSIYIQGWLGAGKTEAIIRSLAQANPGKLIIWTTTRNGLLYQTLARCDKAGIVHCYHYQADVNGNRLLLDSGSDALITMAGDSFKDYAVGRVDHKDTILVVDEFRSVRCEILSKPEAFPEFERALREADTLIVADAFLSDADRAVLKQYRGKDRVIYRQKFTPSKKPIYWLESLTKDGKISFNHEGVYLDLIDRWCEQGGRFAIGVDCLLIAKQLASYLRKRGKQAKVVSSETVESNQSFLSGPDEILEAERPDFLIYTPTAQAGLDVQAPFDRGLLISTGVLSPIDMLQMLGRCRQCKEWHVSAPRFTGSTDAAPIDLDGVKVAAWGQKLGQTFEQLDLQTSPNTHAWAEWQNATREIEKAFNSEYLRYLLEHFFASVETVTVQSFRTQEWRDSREAVQKQDVISTLSANLQNGQQILRQKRQPVYDHEVWDVKLAEHHARFPQVVEGLIQRFALIKDRLNAESAIQEWGSIEALKTAVSNLAGQLAEAEEPLAELQEKLDVAQRIYAETPDADTAERLAILQHQAAVALQEYDQVNQKGMAATSAYQAVRREESEIDEIVGIAKCFFSRRVGRLKNWRMAVRPDGLELLHREVRSRFTNSHTQHWKQFVYTKLFTALNLGQLAKATGDKLTPHRDSFNRHSQVIDELWGRFCGMAPVRELFPAVETKDAFWGLVRKVMGFMGFQSVSDRFRVDTDELHRNGKNRHGRQRYSRSQVQYFVGWLQMEISGSLVFQELFPLLVEAIDDWIEREQTQKQEYRDRQERQRQEAERWRTAA